MHCTDHLKDGKDYSWEFVTPIAQSSIPEELSQTVWFFQLESPVVLYHLLFHKSDMNTVL